MENETIEFTDEVTCVACMTVPISHLALEDGVSVPLAGWQSLFDELEIKTVTDQAGRAAIVQPAARKLFKYLRRRDELAAESAAQRFEKLDARRPAMAGFPPVEGMTALESLAASPGYQTLADEYPGRARPDFLREEIEAGEKHLAERKREAEARAKERLTEGLKDRLR